MSEYRMYDNSLLITNVWPNLAWDTTSKLHSGTRQKNS